jgi:hypothetical protein
VTLDVIVYPFLANNYNYTTSAPARFESSRLAITRIDRIPTGRPLLIIASIHCSRVCSSKSVSFLLLGGESRLAGTPATRLHAVVYGALYALQAVLKYRNWPR